MQRKNLLRKTLGLLLAVATLAGMTLPASAAEVTFTTLIEAKYEDADHFSEGLAAVRQGGKWGYIDETGKTVLPFRYDKAYPFNEGLAVIGKIEQREVWHETDELDADGMPIWDYGMVDVYCWYVIDRSGREMPLTAPQYATEDSNQPEELPLFGVCSEVEKQSVSPLYYNGYINLQAYADAQTEGMINLVYDRQGKRMDSPYVAIGSFTEGTFACYQPPVAGIYVVDEAGKVLMSSEDSQQDCFMESMEPFNQGLAPVYYYSEANGGTWGWGFMNKQGDIVIENRYENFYVSGLQTAYEVFNDGIGAVQLPDGKWGGINKSGGTVIPFAYDYLRSFNEGLTAAQKGGKWGVIDTANNVVVPFQYDALSGYSNGLCVAVQNGRAFCIDRYGKEIPGSDSVDVSVYFPEGLDGNSILTPSDIIVVEQNGKYGFMTMDYTADLPQKTEMDGWAYEEVVAAIKADLVPQYLQNQYKTNITRADFAALAVELITTETGKTAEQLVKEATGKTMEQLVAEYPFTDANSEDILTANALGIINGKGNGIFDPYGLLTRQDAATMLMRVGKYLGKTDLGESDTAFSDGTTIAGYAQEAVEYVNALGVMNGTSATTFSPKGTYTRQQAYITSYRLFEALQ